MRRAISISRPHGVDRHDRPLEVERKVFRLLDTESLQRGFAAWAASLAR
jgi:hypothetical protein